VSRRLVKNGIPAISNSVFNATGVRLVSLPLSAEKSARDCVRKSKIAFSTRKCG
jgi:hypothetical protein